VPFSVRRIDPGDAERLRVVRLTALADTPSAFGSTHAREAAFPPEEWTARARQAASGPERALLLAEEGERVIGLVGGHRDDPAGRVVEIVSMWVAPSHRRRGVGHALVGAIVDWAADTGASSLALWVTRGNRPAEELYRTMGFAPTDDVRALPSDPCRDELRMVLVLPTGRQPSRVTR
jgi:GNAT superfamily N-acetyltransferase